MDSIIHSLNQMGLTDSEAKVYLELLRSGSQNGYEVSKNSGIPRSKIYGLLETLVKKGFVLSSKSGRSKHYQAMTPQKVLGEKKETFLKVTEELEEQLSAYENAANLEYLWQVKGRQKILDRCRTILEETEQELFIQVWQEDLPEILEDLQRLQDKGITPITILYTNEKPEIPLDNVFLHGYLEEKRNDLGGRWITIVSDSNQTIFALMQNEHSEGIWTENTPFVFLAKEYVKHDAYCLSLIHTAKEINHDRMNDAVRNVRNLLKLGKYGR